MGDADLAACQDLDLALGHPDRVGRDHPGAEKADLVEPDRRALAGLRLVLVDLPPGLREVEVAEGSLLLREGLRAEPGLLPAHVDPLGGHEGIHPPPTRPPVDERPGVVERLPSLRRQLRIRVPALPR